MGTYSPRVEALEAGFNAGTCGTRLCLKCVLASLPVVQPPGVESDDPPVPAGCGCDGRPVHTMIEIFDAMRRDITNDDELSGEA